MSLENNVRSGSLDSARFGVERGAEAQCHVWLLRIRYVTRPCRHHLVRQFVAAHIYSSLKPFSALVHRPILSIGNMATLLMARSALRRSIVPMSLGLTASLMVASRQSPMRLDARTPAVPRPVSTSPQENLNPDIIKQLSSGSIAGIPSPSTSQKGLLIRHRFRDRSRHQLVLEDARVPCRHRNRCY